MPLGNTGYQAIKDCVRSGLATRLCCTYSDADGAEILCDTTTSTWFSCDVGASSLAYELSKRLPRKPTRFLWEFEGPYRDSRIVKNGFGSGVKYVTRCSGFVSAKMHANNRAGVRFTTSVDTDNGSSLSAWLYGYFVEYAHDR